ncbi:PQQ-binding-like beta-propeller repeat protein [Microbacterium sp. KUDC0406]|uniref:outer membrane protein assembly factor BamB family protein n=1 Tax=Microbacterium sp. KUDC0406 TaxID=2909588 RepID=UPI001F464C01|nr:PQQ-binding-like beta-propeller repeat protein [Microbacterium sp. KUDC0406]UJP09651.1 PQQ-binding-like beta-propeller repeat protein [Microbacterium sp. KUDC0406]
MTDGTPAARTPMHTPLSRRGFLGLSAVGLGVGLSGAAWGPWPGAAVESANASEGGLRFAVLTDTHANEEEAERLANLRRVFAAIEAEDPQFVLHCGDITDYGSDAGFETYRGLIPDALWDRIRHAPGNHEIRWDTSARERFQRWFGPTSYSFDAGGVHFMALDPTQLLQEPALFAEDLKTIRDDLDGAGDTPSIMFLHYPLGGINYYANDTEDLLHTIDPYPVRGIFAGHIHRNEVTAFNGLTQVAAIASRLGPYYLRVTQSGAGRSRALVVEQVTLGPTDAEEPTVQQLAVIPLGTASSGAERMAVAARPSSAAVALTAVPHGKTTAAEARIYPQSVFGLTDDSAWTPLARRGNSWHGAVDTSPLAPGRHRVQVRATDAAGGHRYETALIERSGRTLSRPAWEIEVGGQLQGSLASHGSIVVTGSTSGRVIAVDAGSHGRRPKTLWRAQLGPVHRGAAFTSDGHLVLVPSADHRLYALDARTGRIRWTSRFDKPVLTTPLVRSTRAGDRILVSAEDRLRCLDVAGTTLWEAAVPIRTAGRAASDGERVYVGAGDGRGYAYDLRTGRTLWSVLTTDRPDKYRQLIYGPWDDWIEVLPGGAVLFSTVTDGIAVDPATGREVWRAAGSYIFAPSVVLDDGGLLMVSEWGVATVLDPATGTARWSSQAVPRVVNAGPVIDPRSGTAWLVSVGGLLAAIDTADGAVTVDRQLFTANTFSTPVVVDGQLIVAAQDGVLRGLKV